jgi:hypothetical protein
MPRKLFPYGKFLGLDSITSFDNMSERYQHILSNAYVDFRGQVHKGPGFTGAPNSATSGVSGVVAGAEDTLSYTYRPSGASVTMPSQMGTWAEGDAKGKFAYSHCTVVHTRNNILRGYFGGISRCIFHQTTSTDYDDIHTFITWAVNYLSGGANNTITLAASGQNHGLQNGEKVYYLPLGTSTSGEDQLPLVRYLNLIVGKTYYICNRTDETVQLEETPSGGAISNIVNSSYDVSTDAHALIPFERSNIWYGENEANFNTGTTNRFNYSSSIPDFYIGDSSRIAGYEYQWVEFQDLRGDSTGNSKSCGIEWNWVTAAANSAAESLSDTTGFYHGWSDYTGSKKLVPINYHPPASARFLRDTYFFMRGWDPIMYVGGTADTSTGTVNRWRYARNNVEMTYVIGEISAGGVCTESTTSTIGDSIADGQKLTVGNYLDRDDSATGFTAETGLEPDMVYTVSDFAMSGAKATFRLKKPDGNYFSHVANTSAAYYASVTLLGELGNFPRGGSAVVIQDRLVVADLIGSGLQNTRRDTELHISALGRIDDWRTNTSGGDTALATDGAVIDVRNQFQTRDRIVGLGVLEGDKLVVFGQNEILVYITDTDINKWILATDFRVNIGLFGRNTVVNVGQELLFCSKYGIHTLRRAASGLTLESKLISAQITPLFTQRVAECHPNTNVGRYNDEQTSDSFDASFGPGLQLGSVANNLPASDASSQATELVDATKLHANGTPIRDGFANWPFAYLEPQAFFDADIGIYHVFFPDPLEPHKKASSISMTYQPKPTGQAIHISFSSSPSSHEGPTCGSYMQVMADEYRYDRTNPTSGEVVSQWYNSGVANTVTGANYYALYTGTDLEDTSAVSQSYSASGLFGKFGKSQGFDFRTPTLWQGTPDTYKYFKRLLLRCWQDEGITTSPKDYEATLTLKFYDEANNLRDTRIITPPPKDRVATYDAGTGDTNFTGVRPVEVPLAIRAKGLSVQATTAAGVEGQVVITDFGLIVDTK